MHDLVAIVGPTASGKTALSVELAHRLSGEIISADSMLVYKYLDIGTAKPSCAEMEGVPHHMIDLVPPDEVFTVFEYQARVFLCIDEIVGRGNIPMLVGGTGLYVQSVLDGYEFGAAHADMGYRERLAQIAASSAPGKLHFALKQIDPESAEKIHPNDHRRIIRALEFFKTTGKPISAQNKQPSFLQSKGFRITRIGLTMDRNHLYRRIEERVDHMIEQGLVEEVQGLQAMGYDQNHYPMQGLGYQQISQYLEGKMTLDAAVAEIKKETRRFAKRQYTWFRRDSQIHWIQIDPHLNREELIRNVCRIIKDI
jgi:tRNA dimethylallyltransferase